MPARATGRSFAWIGCRNDATWLRSDARLVWVGDGPARTHLQREHPDFVFCGMHGEAFARHFANGACLLPGLSETFGNVTLETMTLVVVRRGALPLATPHGAGRRHQRVADSRYQSTLRVSTMIAERITNSSPAPSTSALSSDTSSP